MSFIQNDEVRLPMARRHSQSHHVSEEWRIWEAPDFLNASGFWYTKSYCLSINLATSNLKPWFKIVENLRWKVSSVVNAINVSGTLECALVADLCLRKRYRTEPEKGMFFRKRSLEWIRCWFDVVKMEIHSRTKSLGPLDSSILYLHGGWQRRLVCRHPDFVMMYRSHNELPL